MAYIGNRVVAGVGSAVKVDLDAPTNALRVKNDGKIGIGKSDPTAPLDVAGQIKATSIATTNNIDIASGATTGSAILNIGANRSGNGYGYIDIVGDTTYTDYGLRLIRSNGGANTNSQLAHRGTGQLQLVVQDAGALVAITSNTERMRIDSAGNVGIGTSSPSSTLELNVASGNLELKLNGATATHGIRNQSDGSFGHFDYTNSRWLDLRNYASDYYTLFTAGAERMRIDSSGNVGIGLTNPIYPLSVSTTSGTIARFAATTNTAAFEINSPVADYIALKAMVGDGLIFSTNNNEKMRINTDGDVLPGANGTQDFGSTSLRWANIYTSDLHLNNGIGNYTIVEGEEDLFLYNNKNGKTYKFVLAEVDPSEAPKKMEK